MLDDILSETPAYKSIERKGLEKGLEKGREEGIAMGHEEERQLRLSSLRQKLLTILENRFPKLHPLTKKLTAQITRPDVLENLMVQLALARNFNEAQEALLEMAALND
ncbi:MAG: hypothetical protein E6J34_13745 [Chloroflexi bacterium]|nr:MAG: hypothetical protein E6J34_13745 [Chloroflexota bacterium]